MYSNIKDKKNFFVNDENEIFLKYNIITLIQFLLHKNGKQTYHFIPNFYRWKYLMEYIHSASIYDSDHILPTLFPIHFIFKAA